MTSPNPSESLPETPAGPDTFEPEAIVIPYDEVLAPLVGKLDDLRVETVKSGVVRFSGLDEEHGTVAGVMTPRLVTGADAKSIEVSWEVEVDAPPGRR